MTHALRALAPGVLARLFRVDRPHLVRAYNRGLAHLGLEPTRLDAFRVDAAGWSPEVAAERGDPAYLRVAPGHPAFLVVSVEQLEAPLVQPDAGAGAWAYSAWAPEAAPALVRVALGEPVVGTFTHGLSRVAFAGQLGLLREVERVVEVPSGRLAVLEETARLGARLLGEPEAWRDDGLLARLRLLAPRAGGLVAVPEPLRSGVRLPLGPSIHPGFGGCAVWPGRPGEDGHPWVLFHPGRGADEGDAVARAAEDGVRLLPMTPEAVCHLLVALRLVDPRPSAAALEARDLDDLRDRLVERARGAPAGRAGSLKSLSAQADVCAELQELEDVRLRARPRGGEVDLGRASARTRLRLMPRLTSDPIEAWWVEHLRARLDPVLAARFVAAGLGPLSGLFTGPRDEDLLVAAASERRKEVAAWA